MHHRVKLVLILVILAPLIRLLCGTTVPTVTIKLLRDCKHASFFSTANEVELARPCSASTRPVLFESDSCGRRWGPGLRELLQAPALSPFGYQSMTSHTMGTCWSGGALQSLQCRYKSACLSWRSIISWWTMARFCHTRWTHTLASDQRCWRQRLAHKGWALCLHDRKTIPDRASLQTLNPKPPKPQTP